MNTYSIELWDHDPADDGTRDGEWSGELARQHLDGPSEGLTLRQTGEAIRRLRSRGWSEVTMFVRRNDR